MLYNRAGRSRDCGGTALLSRAEDDLMWRLHDRLPGGLGLALLLLASACASGGADALGSQVPIADIKSIAGVWEGLMRGAGGTGRDQGDYVVLTLAPDGAYVIQSARVIGVLDARGIATVGDGMLVLKGGERTTASGRLYMNEDRRTLLLEATTPERTHLTARLSPKR